MGGVAAEVPTGGVSTFLVVASWLSLASAAVQCVNGVIRVGEALRAPDDNSLQRWANEQWYSGTMLFVDAVGVGSGIASLPFAMRNLWAVLARQRRFAAQNLNFEALKAMNRSQRLRAISEVFEDAARTPEGRAALVQAAREAQIGAHTLQQGTALSVRHADRMRSIISEETARRLAATLRDIIGNAVGAAGSAMPDRLIGSASGFVNYVINLVAPAAR